MVILIRPPMGEVSSRDQLMRLKAALPIAELWYSVDPNEWELALERYWQIDSAKRNLKLEISLEQTLTLMRRLRCLNAQQWYDFLHDEYFPWKFDNLLCARII